MTTSEMILAPSLDLTAQVVPKVIPLSEQYRRVYGARTDLVQIEDALRGAEQGYMSDLCDLETEILKLDPHLTSLLAKRVGVLGAADWDVTPPDGIDRGDLAQATKIANTIAGLFRAIPFFNERIEDLAWALFDGRSCLEIHWETNVGGLRLAPTALEWVHPRRLAFGRERDLRIIDPGMSRGFNDPGISVDDLPGKFLSWTPRLFREYPEREGLAPRTLYWGFFKRFDTVKRMALTELIALPWRIITLDKDAPADAIDLQRAKEQADNLGAENTAAFGRGTKLDVYSVQQGVSELFKFSHEQVNSEMSKLVEGNAGTSDLEANRANGIIGKGEKDIITQRDGNGCAARIQHHLVLPATVAIFGAGARHLAPKFSLRVQPPRDRKSELERVRSVLSFGVPVPVSSIRETSGIRAPANDEPYVMLVKSGGTDAFGKELPGSYEVVDPSKPQAPGGAGGEGAPGAPQGTSGPSGEDAAEPGEEGTAEGDGVDGAAARALADMVGLERSCACLFESGPSGGSKHMASAVYGSVEPLVEKGTREGARATAKWVAAMLDAVDAGPYTAPALHKRLTQAAARLDLEGFAAAAGRRMIVGLALGALDADWEAENDRVIKPPAFSITTEMRAQGEEAIELARRQAYKLEDESSFVTSPFNEALRFFRSKKVMSKRAFDRLSGEAKRRAFTISGMASKSVLEVAHMELTRQLETGGDLRAFRAALAERYELAGWVASNPSHVETVFRNAVVGSYASGRDAQMRQPEVLEARPYWQIMGVGDARTRETHRAAHGKVLAASDPFWKKAPLPWGHNCRDRKVSRSAEAVARLGLEVVPGSSLRGLPDDGWDSSGSLLFDRTLAEDEEETDLVQPEVELPFAQRNAAFLADLNEYRALGITPDVKALARLHEVPAPKES